MAFSPKLVVVFAVVALLCLGNLVKVHLGP
jgi:hypothetical protein